MILIFQFLFYFVQSLEEIFTFGNVETGSWEYGLGSKCIFPFTYQGKIKNIHESIRLKLS